jgi:hypothetical protein
MMMETTMIMMMNIEGIEFKLKSILILFNFSCKIKIKISFEQNIKAKINYFT